jgi:hypothetical protein
VHTIFLYGVCRVFICKVTGPSLTGLDQRAPKGRLPGPPPPVVPYPEKVPNGFQSSPGLLQ